MGFLVRILTIVLVMMMASMLQVSHTIGNVDHYNEKAQIPSMLTYGGLNNAGGDHHHQEEVDGIVHHHSRKKTIVLAIKNPPIDEQEVINFFSERFGHVESYIQKGPGHALIIFRYFRSASAVRRSDKKFVINGIHVVASKFIP